MEQTFRGTTRNKEIVLKVHLDKIAYLQYSVQTKQNKIKFEVKTAFLDDSSTEDNLVQKKTYGLRQSVCKCNLTYYNYYKKHPCYYLFYLDWILYMYLHICYGKCQVSSDFVGVSKYLQKIIRIFASCAYIALAEKLSGYF